MISAIEIEGLRGIKHGKLEGLTPLTILTGPNGCGKSTVLDALLIGANVSPDQGVIQAVQRRPETRNGARWLIRNGSSSISCAVDDRSLATTLKLSSTEPIAIVVGESGYLEFSPENKAHVHRTFGLRLDVAEIKLIDPALVISLYRVFSQVVREGRGMMRGGLDASLELDQDKRCRRKQEAEADLELRSGALTDQPLGRLSSVSRPRGQEDANGAEADESRAGLPCHTG